MTCGMGGNGAKGTETGTSGHFRPGGIPGGEASGTGDETKGTGTRAEGKGAATSAGGGPAAGAL
jgi:hypothetical protein